AQMAITGSVEPAELRRRVTSPGGTTERAISIMEQQGLRDTFLQALTGAYDRSKELAGYHPAIYCYDLALLNCEGTTPQRCNWRTGLSARLSVRRLQHDCVDPHSAAVAAGGLL